MSSPTNTKERAIQLLCDLPDDVSFEQISREMETLELLASVEASRRRIRDGGRVYSTDEVRAKLSEWTRAWDSESLGKNEPSRTSAS